MKHYEAHRYLAPSKFPAHEGPTRWREPSEGCRLVAVLPDDEWLIVVWEMPQADECVDVVNYFERQVAVG